MAAYIPSWRGISAVVLALLAGVFLPALTPARHAPIPQHVWVIGSASLFLCLIASIVAIMRKTKADLISGILPAAAPRFVVGQRFQPVLLRPRKPDVEESKKRATVQHPPNPCVPRDRQDACPTFFAPRFQTDPLIPKRSIK